MMIWLLRALIVTCPPLTLTPVPGLFSMMVSPPYLITGTVITGTDDANLSISIEICDSEAQKIPLVAKKQGRILTLRIL
jgi:hypothetical protein